MSDEKKDGIVYQGDLRIGNWLYLTKTGLRNGYQFQKQIDAETLYHIATGAIKCKPIPLDERWRSKFLVDNIPFLKFKGNFLYLRNPINGSLIKIKEVKWVHVLQNIYYDLCDKQLEINYDDKINKN